MSHEEEPQSIELVSSSELYERYEQFLLGEVSELSEEDREELGKVTHLFSNFCNPNWHPAFNNLKAANYILDLRALKNVRDIPANFCFANKQVRKILWDFQHLESVGNNFLYHADNLESADFASWNSIKQISGHNFWLGKREEAKYFNLHKLKHITSARGHENHPCFLALRQEIENQVLERSENRKRDLLNVHLVAFKGSSKLGEMLHDTYAPRLMVLKFLLGNIN